jgi:dienelactone hydrolase
MRKKILGVLLAIVATGAIAAYTVNWPEQPDTQFSGAYALADGSLVFISPREGSVLRYRTMTGESAALWPVGEGHYEGGVGWAEREPVVNRIWFDIDTHAGKGRPAGFTWQQGAGPPRHARALQLREQIFTFQSGELKLRGKLVLPEGAGPFPVVVLVHGSESDSAVDYYFEPYMYAANGFAGLVFDKRGTGESEGQYLQNFDILSDDVLAAVHWLRRQQTIDASRIHLAGFSQGGWIAPLAALKDGHIRSVLVGYGVMLPVTAEDRWGYVYALRQKGFDDAAIAQADRINEVIEGILDRRENRWSELSMMLDGARAEPWYEAVRGSDSALGLVTASKMPLWMMRLYVWYKLDLRGGPRFIDRTYDPVLTAKELHAPMLWLLAGDDSSAPTPWTIEELRKLQAEGAPLQYVVYPHVDHGILRYEQGKDGERHLLGYAPEYFPRQVEWLREQSQL